MSQNKGSQIGPWSDKDTNICGDTNWITPSVNPVARYTAGQTVPLRVSVNAFHDGYYEFRLCVPNQVTDMPPSTNQGMIDCVLTAPLLKRKNPLPAGSRATYKILEAPVWTQQNLETRWRQTPEDGKSVDSFRSAASFELEYIIPSNVQCEHCVLHFYWQSLNSWQTGDAKTIGTTQGERFWNCADIAIDNPTAKARGITTGFVDVAPTPQAPTPVPVPKSSPTPVPVPKSSPTPVPVPKSSPTPVPVPKAPVPVPQVSVPTSSGGCSGVQYGSTPGEWWTAIVAPKANAVTVKCANSETRSCDFDSGWGRFTCTLSSNGRSCPLPHVAIVDGVSCTLNPSLISSASDTGSVSETNNNGAETETSDNTGTVIQIEESVPGWAVALLVIGSIAVVSLFVVVIVVATASSKTEKF